MEDRRRQAGEKFERLVSIMARLRGPDGCPWDREQTFDTIKPYTVEETYEVLDAIDERDWLGLADELGDFMLQAVFYAQMAEEHGRFRIEDCLNAINDKLERRHPHIFGEAKAETADDVKKRWDEIKIEEKARRGTPRTLLLDSASRSAPALVQAQQISSLAAKAGFDWQSVEQVIEKLHEELDELNTARNSANQEEVHEELGDLLFVIVNLARFLRVDPEQALRSSNLKFRSRFNHVEQALQSRGRSFAQSTMEEMEELWHEAKRSG